MAVSSAVREMTPSLDDDVLYWRRFVASAKSAALSRMVWTRVWKSPQACSSLCASLFRALKVCRGADSAAMI